jgi:hypothetical protein
MGAKIEVDEDVWNQNEGIRKVVAAIAADPKRRAALEKLHKEVDPNIKTPTLDAEKTVSEPVQQLRDELAALRKEQAEEKAKSDQEARQAKLNSDFEAGRRWCQEQGFQAAGLEAIEKIMADKGILDHKIAAAFWEKENPPPAPAMPGGSGSWNFLDLPTNEDGDVDIKNLIQSVGSKSDGNVDRITNKLAQEALMEIRQTHGRR